MPSASQKIFNSHVAQWESYVQAPLGAIRQELTCFVLATYLPKTHKIKKVLDAGCGLGDAAELWLERGCQVYLCDFAPAMLARAREGLLLAHPEWESRLHFVEAPVQDLPDRFAPGFFDLILCHTLLEYVKDAQATVRQLVGLLRKDGFFSCTAANRFSEPWHLALRNLNPRKAAGALEGGISPAKLFQNMPRRSFSPAEAVKLLAQSGLTSCEELGIRIFADYLPEEKLREAKFFHKVIELERRALDKDPYRHLARYIHIIARKGNRRLKRG
jgi:S-adenosylmethionine-dependent methyltransferase